MLMFSARVFLRSFRYLPVRVAVLSFFFAPAAAQKSSVGQPQPSPEDIKKFAAIAGRFGQLSQKLRTRVTLPTPRTESHLLPLLPESTLMYAAIPNYGEATRQ